MSMVPCKVCGEAIKDGAKKCKHCGSFQNWRRYLAMGSSIVAVTVALVSVLSLSIALLTPVLTPERASLGIVFHDIDPDGVISTTFFNHGTREGFILSASLVFKESNKEFEIELQARDHTVEDKVDQHAIKFDARSFRKGGESEIGKLQLPNSIPALLLITVEEKPGEQRELTGLTLSLEKEIVEAWLIEHFEDPDTGEKSPQAKAEEPIPPPPPFRPSITKKPISLRPPIPRPSTGQSLVVAFQNLQSGDSKIEKLATSVSHRSAEVDIWGFAEVQDKSWASMLGAAAAETGDDQFRDILGTTGGPDRLLIIYDHRMLELVDSIELQDINIGGTARAPLVAQFKLRSDGKQFLFMVNHLYRARSTRRHAQAELLNEWASVQELPIIAVGDYNFDWDIDNGDTNHDEGYDKLIADGIFEWLRPSPLIKTQDSRYDDVLDFVFTSGAAQDWGISSTIIVVPGDFPDDETTSDHRPVMARFVIPESGID